MSFLLKNMLSQKMKNLSGGGGEEEKTETGDGTPTPASTGMTREEFEEYQRQERDNRWLLKKAERATLRVHMREKYRLPQSEKDENHIQMVGGDVDLPEDLAKMVEADEEEEEANDSFLGSIQNMDFDMFKNKAQDTFIEIKQSAEEKCSVM
uniref:Complexin 4c n=1 Tax=Callorhinchus milii TaxID=7868 RepID=A0A4W3GLM1_CALMI